MIWFKKRSKRRTGNGRKPKRAGHPVWAARGRSIIRMAVVLAIAATVAGAIWGTERLESYVRAQPEYQVPPKIVLTDVPPSLAEKVYKILAPFNLRPWSDPQLCRAIATALDDSAWIERVHWVRRFGDRRVLISCAYRMPAALVQVEHGFCLASDDAVRLPGRYGYHPSLVLIQGAGGHLPAPGESWQAGDVRAALDIIKLLHDEPYFNQITGVLVENYGGRLNKRLPQVVLATAPGSGRIVWGSAPGEEIEENTAAEKIGILRENYRRWGRIDAGRDSIDVSVFPDRFTTPSPT